MVNHGVNAKEKATSVSTPVVAQSGIPYVVGTAPVHTAENSAPSYKPVLCTSWDEAVKMFGYSDNWTTYTLCEFMYSHFKLYKRQPVIFCNIWDNLNHVEETTSELTVTDHKAKLPLAAVNNFFTIQAGSSTLRCGTDFDTYYEGESLVIELLESGSGYNEKRLSVTYQSVSVAPTSTDIAMGIRNADYCITSLGVVPDVLCAPGWSGDSTVAAVMATTAAGISSLFKAKALCDINSDKHYIACEVKKEDNIVDSEQIACWPKVKLGDKVFHLSTQLAGLMATIDSEKGGVPCESPSNKNLKCDCLVNDEGEEIDLGIIEANNLNDNGIVTAINFTNGFVAWGNYTSCYPSNTDVKDCFIPVSRSMKWVENTLIKTFWAKVDNPLNRRLIDSIVDSANIWLNSLVANGYFLGAEVKMLEEENTLTNLMAGKITFHLYITPPSPAQRIDWVVEYDTNNVISALS